MGLLRLLTLGLLPSLCGCVGLAVAGAGAAGFGDGRTPIDHTLSWLEGKTCSVTRYRQGLTYCAEDEPAISYRGHCFRTLGEVTCYTNANPYPGRQAPVAGAPAGPAGGDQGVAPSSPLARTPSNMN